MINNRNKIIVFVVLAVLIVGSIVLINNKDIKVSNVSSSGKKYEVSYEKAISISGCDRYVGGETKVYGMDQVEEGYPLYSVNGCATTLDWLLGREYIDNSIKVEACQAQKNFVKSNYYASESHINYYNTTCVDEGYDNERLEVKYYNGGSCPEMKKLIEKKYADFWYAYENWYIQNCKSSYGDIDKSKVYNYYNEPGNCESMKLVKGTVRYTGLLRSGETANGSKNTCKYALFYVDGYATGLDDYLSKVSDAKKNEACSYKKDLAEKGYESDYEDYNNYCADKVSGFTKMDPIEKVKIRFEARDGYGIDCPLNYGGADSTCEYSAIKGKSTTISLPEVKKTYDGKGLTQNGTGAKFSFWSTDQTCQNGEEISGLTTSKKFNLNNDITYYACYETNTITFKTDSAFEDGIDCSGHEKGNGVCEYYVSIGDNIILPNVSTTNEGKGLLKNYLYKFRYWAKDGDCENGNRITLSNTQYTVKDVDLGTYYACYDENEDSILSENYANIYKSCNAATDYQATLTSTIKTTDIYSTESQNNNQSITKSDKTYTINKYCPMTCSEIFTYTYPSMFETVKSGTYFELIYTPQVKSTYKCTQTFKYNDWENDYNTAIENEKKAYVDYQNAEGINVINSPSDYGSEDSSCGVKRSWSCGTREHPKTCYEYYKRYNVSFTPQVYDISSKTFGNGTSVSATYCENDNIRTAKSSLFNQLYQQLDTTKKLSEISGDTDSTYLRDKGKRESLQNMNKTCYNTLTSSISAVTTEKFYSVKPNVFIEYDLDTTMNNKVKLTTDSPYYSNDNLDRKDVTEEYNISYGSTNEKFNAYTFGDNHVTTRTKEVNYEFHTDFNYYSSFYTGSINNESNGIHLGNVFPVRLASSGKRNISFVMDTSNDSTFSGNVRSKLSEGNNNTYKCTYNISNDAVVLDDESKRDNKDEDKKDYKTTFFVRPVATNDVDPNNRLDKGLLGANWASKKGQELIKIIEDKSKNNNTYNPNNLEYSFTLNANTLDQIREYNKTKGSYDNVDWSENCNELGMECQSKFLNGLSNGSLGAGMKVTNTNSKLDGRDKKKYYINGEWVELDKITSYTGSECSSFKGNVSNYYDCLYRNVNEGVTP